MKFKTRDINKKEYGPFEMEDVIHKIYPQTQIKFEGEEKWQIAGHLKLFQDEFRKRKRNSYLPKGRMGRENYFGYTILLYLLFAYLRIVFSSLADDYSITSIIVSRVIAVFMLVLVLIVIYAKIVTMVKRLHDLNLNGLWCILALPTIPVSDLLLFFWPGKRGKNKYGHDPKYRSVVPKTNNTKIKKEDISVSIQKIISKSSKLKTILFKGLKFVRNYSSLVTIFILSFFVSVISGFYFKGLDTDNRIKAIRNDWKLDETYEFYRLKDGFFSLEHFDYNWIAFLLTFIGCVAILTFLRIYSIKSISVEKLKILLNKIEGRP